MLDQQRFAPLDPRLVNRLKRDFYGILDRLRAREEAAFFSAKTRDLAAGIFATSPSAAEAKDLPRYARQFLEIHGTQFGRLMEHLAAEIDLESSTRELDRVLAGLDAAQWPAAVRREVLVNYLGFPFWDVLTFSVATARNAGEFNEILIDRISPQDAHALEGFSGPQSLKGLAFGHFAAFLSRAYRENDYLLGRLHAIDRLIDIVCDAAEPEVRQDGRGVLALKRKAFLAVLEAETKHLPNSAELLAALRESIAKLDAG
jgi:hypothetical protein